MDIRELASQARTSISAFCVNDCGAYCCRKGYLEMTLQEAKLIAGKDLKVLQELKIINHQDNGLYALHLGSSLGGCPQLDGSFCKIHKDPSRPKTCDTFPIFVDVDKKIVRLSPRCFAVKENKLYPYVHQFLKLGFSVKNE